MSKFVDERVVEMSFENKKFESGVKQSMSTLDRLKNALDFSGVGNSINGQLNGINTSGLSSAVLGARKSFTALEIAAITSIANITNRLVNLGIQFTKSLSIDQLGEGWTKFSQIAVSEATLLAQGFEQSDVSGILEKLTWYADETSYSLTDMVDNMSKFTASGRGLDESANAMMGIANWAALAGQNSQKASVAMYQLSQSLGRGTVRWQDWRSIVNANMDTKEFRQKALEMAVLQGELVDNMDGTFTALNGKTFNADQFTDSLAYDWFTSDVLLGTLNEYAEGANKIFELIDLDDEVNTATDAIKKYGDEIDAFQLKAFLAAQEARTFKDMILAVQDATSSGYMMLFTQLFGSVDEAKVFWTDLANELYNVFMDGMWKKIDILGEWADLGGRDDLWANTEEETGAFWNLFNALVAIKDLISGAWGDVFGFSEFDEYGDQVTDIATQLKDLTQRIQDFTEKLFLNKEATEDVRNIFRGLFGIFKIIGRTIGAVLKGFSPLIELLGGALGQSNALSFFGDLGNIIANFADNDAVFESITESMHKFFNTIIKFVKESPFINAAVNNITTALEWLREKISANFIPTVKTLGVFFSWLGLQIVDLYHKTGALIARFINWIKTSERIQNGFQKFKNVLSDIGRIFKTAYESVIKFFSSFSSNKSKEFKDMPDDTKKKFEPLSAFMQGLVNLFEGLWNLIKAVSRVVGKLFTFLGDGLTFIGNKLKSIFTNSSGDVDFAKLFTVGFWATVAVGIYRFAEMMQSITDVFREAFDGMFDYFNSKAMQGYMEAIKSMATSILMMVGALLILGAMDAAVLKKSLASMTVLIGFIVGTMLLMKNLITTISTGSVLKQGLFKSVSDVNQVKTNLMGLGSAFAGLGIAVLLLTQSLKMLTRMDPSKVTYGLVILGTLFTMMAVTMRVVGKAEKSANKAVKSMVKVAISIALLRKPLEQIGEMDTVVAIKGLVGIGTLMFILGIYSKQAKSIKADRKPIMSLVGAAMALTLLTVPLAIIGNMKYETLGKSLGTIMTLMLMIMALNKLTGKHLTSPRVNNMTMMLKSLIPLAVAMTIMAGAFFLLGSIPLEKIAKALGTMAVIFGMLIMVNKITGKKLTAPRMKNLNLMVLSLIPLAIGLKMMLVPLLALGLMPLVVIIKALITIRLIFGIIISINRTAGKQLTKPRMKNMLRMILSLIPLSIGMMALATGLLALGSLPLEKIVKGLTTLTVVFLLLGGLNALLAYIGGAAGLGTLAMAFAGFSGAMILFTVALGLLGSLPVKTIVTGLLAVLAVFTILGVAGYLLAPVIPIIVALGAALLMMGGSVLLFGLGVMAVATGFSILIKAVSEAADNFGEKLRMILLAIVKNGPLMMAAILSMIGSVTGAIIVGMPMIVQALLLLISELLRIFKELTPMIVDTILELLTILLGGIVKIFPKVYEAIFDLLMGMFDTLISKMPLYIEKLVYLFVTLLRSIRQHMPTIAHEGALFIADLVDSLVTAIVVLYPRLANAMFDLIIGMIDGIGQAVEERSEELGQAMKRFGEYMWNALLNFFGINSPSTKMMEMVGHLVDGIKKGFADRVEETKEAITEFAKKIIEGFNNTFNGGIEQGKKLLNGIKEGAEEVWSTVRSWFDTKARGILGFFSAKVESFKETGKDFLTNIKNGAVEGWTNTKAWFEEKVTWIEDEFKKLPEKFLQIGKDIVGGLIDGLEETWSDVEDVLLALINFLPDWAKSLLGIQSPSRVFKEIGGYVSEGMAIGIGDNADMVEKNATDMANSAVDGVENSGLSGVMAAIYNMLTGDMDNDIVIRPVLDLSEIQNGLQDMNNMFGDSYGINGSNDIARSTRDVFNSSAKTERAKTKSGGNSPVNNETINNTFNITGANAKEIANEVSKVLQNQVDRRKAKYGYNNI